MAKPKYYWADAGNAGKRYNRAKWWTFLPGPPPPTWQVNFENHCVDIYCSDHARESGWRLHTIMNYELKSYGGKYRHGNIRFNNEIGLMMFLLRWS